MKNDEFDNPFSWASSGLQDEDMPPEEVQRRMSAASKGTTRAEQLVEEALGYEEEQEPQSRNDLMEQAHSRIEQANLYKTIMEAPLFAAGSARPEILAIVEEEIQVFASNKLAELLGMATPKQEDSVSSIFSPEEITALKLLSAKVMGKTPAPAQQPKAPTPTINTIGAAPKQEVRLNNKPTLRTQAQPPAKQPAQRNVKKTTNKKEAPKLSKPIAEMTPEEAREEMERRKEHGTSASGHVMPTGSSKRDRKPMPDFVTQTALAMNQVKEMSQNPIVETLTTAGRKGQ